VKTVDKYFFDGGLFKSNDLQRGKRSGKE